MSLPLQPDAQKDVVTTVSHVLVAFEDMVKDELTGVETVYDEQLTFETGIRSYLTKNNYENQGKTEFPVFLYNRSQLRWPPGVAPSRRLNVLKGALRVGDDIVSYKATQSEFEIQFMYLCRSVEMQERFEVAYQNETGVSANRVVTVGMGEPLGNFNYFLTYGELVNKVINQEDAAYTAIMGQLTVRGFFFTFTGKANLIKQINLRIWGKAGPGPITDTEWLIKSLVVE